MVYVCALAGFAVCSSSQAKVLHKFVPPQLTTVPGTSSQLRETNSIAVDGEDLFVAENTLGSSRIHEFNISTSVELTYVGDFPLPASPIEKLWEGISVGHATFERRAYVGGREIAVYGESAPGTWSFLAKWDGHNTLSGSLGSGSEAIGVAVDNSPNVEDWAKGYVYVADGPKNIIDVLEPRQDATEEVEVAQLEGTGPGKPFSFPLKVSVSEATGDVLVVDATLSSSGKNENVVDIFQPEPGMPGIYKTSLTLTGISPALHFGRIASVAVAGPTSAGKGNLLVAAEILENGVAGSQGVFEFTSTGVFLDEITGKETPDGKFSHITSLATDPVSSNVFVGNRNELGFGSIDRFSDDVVVPDVQNGMISTVRLDRASHKWNATFTGTVNPAGAGPATCWFVWGTSDIFGKETMCVGGGEIGHPLENGGVPDNVHGDVSGLASDSHYYERLQAKNANGINEGEASENRSFTTPGPGLQDSWSSHVSSDSVRLSAAIDPNEAKSSSQDHPVSYYFEYGTTTNYGLVLSGETVGPGQSDVQVEREAQGLSASTIYHYRVVLVAEVEPEPDENPGVVVSETFDGPDHTFITQSALSAVGSDLQDGRVWELVSPINKRGGQVIGLNQSDIFNQLIQSSADGSAFTFVTDSPTEDEVPGNGLFQIQVFGQHTVTGWSSRDIATPHRVKTGLEFTPEYQFFSENLSRGVVVPHGKDDTLLSQLASEPTPYMRQRAVCEHNETDKECYLPLLNDMDVPIGAKFGSEHLVGFVGASPDGDHVILRSDVALTATPTDGFPELYEWSGDKPENERLQLVSVVAESDGVGGKEGPSRAGIIGIGSSPAERWASGPQAITSNGSRVFWTNATAGQGLETPLYLRDVDRAETLRLDLPLVGAKGGSSDARFQGSSSDGSTVFFTDSAQLTSQASKRGEDLYKCEIIQEAGHLKCVLTDLTPEGSDGPSEVQNQALGSSKDGSFVYFVANSKLGFNVEHGGCKPGSLVLSTCNLYAYHDGTIHFVASLSSEDETDWSEGNEILHNLGNLTARVSSDGRFVAFMSNRSLVGYDNRDVMSGMPDQEVYLYDALNDHLACVSCNPTGERPAGSEVANGSLFASLAPQYATQFTGKSWVASNIVIGDVLGGHGESLYQPRVLFDSGRLVFNSSDALVAGDVNGGEDVYEFEPVGVPTGRFACSTGSVSYSAIAGGCVSLISSGRAIGGAGLMDASASGDDIFFVTAERLVGEDVDTAVDVYNAHVCGSGWDCMSESVSPPACADSESCRVAPLPQPGVFDAPPSATFKGQGNVTGSNKKPTARPKNLTRAQRLSRALRVCRKKKARKQRATCERTARKSYGPTKHTSRSKSVVRLGGNVVGGRGR